MATENFNALASFAAVAEERSFTRAAVKLGVSQSALSQVVMNLETRLGLRLLSRTTRAVAPTEAGELLLRALRPAFNDIEAQMAALGDLRDQKSSNIRITTSQHAAVSILWPAVAKFMATTPDVDVELSIDVEDRDIAAERFDAIVRLGNQPSKDMTAVRIGPDLHMMAVASPGYVQLHGKPSTPQDLAGHQSVNSRIPGMGGANVWSHGKDGRELNLAMDHRFASNDLNLILNAALHGFGIAFLMEDLVREHIAAGRLIALVEDWRPSFPGYHLHYPTDRDAFPAFSRLVDALRYPPN